MPNQLVIAQHLMIRGRVQGVSYRASAQAEGQRLGLHGWVRNRHDGSVEALVAGPSVAVAQFIAWARRGPAQAQVVEIDITPAEAPAVKAFVVQATT